MPRSVEEATGLFLTNERLIWFVIHRYFSSVPADAREEMYEEGRYWLWKAAVVYDPERGAFSTFAIRVLRNGIGRWLQDAAKRRNGVGEVLSLSSPLGDEDSDVTLADAIESPVCLEDQVEFRDALDSVKRSSVGRLMVEGMSQTEIAKKLNWPIVDVRLEQWRLLREVAGREPATKPKRVARPRPIRKVCTVAPADLARRLFDLLASKRSHTSKSRKAAV